MPKSPWPAIAVSLTLGALFAAGLGAYLYSTIPSRAELLAKDTVDPGASAAFAGAEALDARVKALASEFVADLAAANPGAAYGLTAAPYRERADLPAFRSQCQASPFLASATGVTLYRVTASSSPGATRSAISATGVLSSSSGAVPITLVFLDEGTQLAILSIAIAGVPTLVSGQPAPATR